jgi:sialidase-1
LNLKPLKIKNIEHGVVIPCGTPDRIPAAAETVRTAGLRMMYHGWPGMVMTSEGDILVGSSEHLLHVDPFGREIITRSKDLGRTWSAPEVMFDSITDDRDISLARLLDGTIVATWFCSDVWAKPRPHPWMRPEWEPIRDQIKPDTHLALSRGWLRRSTDNGRTWERLIHPTLVGQHAGPTVLSNGNLLYCGQYAVEDGGLMVATLSKDGGRTWSIISEMPVKRYFDEVSQKYWSVLNENHALEVSPGNIIVAFRRASGAEGHGERNVYIVRSGDGGYTWTTPEDLGVFGYPPYLLRLKSGPILCLFGQRSEHRKIRGMFSYDDGITWDTKNLITIKECSMTGGIDLGYPTALETESGNIFCIYYEVPTPSVQGYDKLNPSQWGILSTRFRLG